MTGVQTCALPICEAGGEARAEAGAEGSGLEARPGLGLRLGEGLAGGGIASCWGKTTDYMDLVQTCKGPGAGDPPCEVQRPRDPLKAPTH